LQVIPTATVLALTLVVPHVLVNRFSSFLSPIPVVRQHQKSQCMRELDKAQSRVRLLALEGSKTMRSTKRNRRMRWLAAALAVTTGCAKIHRFHFQESASPSYYKTVSTQIEYPGVKSCLAEQVVSTPPPLAIENPADIVTRDITLDEVIRTALQNSDILRSLGGSVVQAPAGTISNYDPALTEGNPLAGVEAALSAFDAQVTSQLFWQKNNRPNNFTFGGLQQSVLDQTAGVFNYEIAKRTATGARFAARHAVSYDLNNNVGQTFRSAFTGWFEGEYRQPLLRGAGTEFNRIAGPNSTVGSYNGVLIARINTDISLADFEQGVITFINDVETAYWELYFVYHNLESQVEGRNSSLSTWQQVMAFQKAGVKGGNAADEAQSRSLYYNFDVIVKDALGGPQGLYATEQRLRYLMGIEATDGSLLRPVSQPMEGEVLLDWSAALNDALLRRVEIRRQKWNIKRRELEVIAARHNRLPTLDFLSQYRYRGLGDALIENRDPNNQFNSLYQSIFEGNFQEWQAGLELAYPVGMRQAGAALAHARWNLARDCARLKEQELRISHDLSNAARQVAISYQLVLSNYNRVDSLQDQVETLKTRYEEGLDNINFLLQARQGLANSKSAYFRELTDYQLALRDFHREKGSLLNYNQVGLSEGAWPAPAYQDAYERGRFFAPRANPSAVEMPSSLSSGSFDPTQVGAMSATNYLSSTTTMSSNVIVNEAPIGLAPTNSEPAAPADEPSSKRNLSVPKPNE
jgi:outer membrane protein TolC